jgi:hypothetical protein
LLLFISAGNQNLRARMIKGNQPSPIPLPHLCRIFFQAEVMIMNELERLKRYSSQRHNYSGLHQFDGAPEKV